LIHLTHELKKKGGFPENIMQKSNPAIPIYHGRQWPVGLSNAAKRLGCSIGHLHHVLTGKRTSPRLKARYDELVAELESGRR
jgi:hypothetical protein